MSTVTITVSVDGEQQASVSINPMLVTVDSERELTWNIVSDDADWVFDTAGVVIAGPNDIAINSGFNGWPQGNPPHFVSDTQYSVSAPDRPVDPAKYRYTINLINKTSKAKIRWDPDIEDRP